ncbi:MAG TPA: VOC family protein [Limnochordales bacterium]
MSELFVPQVGAVFSADIAVPEHDREVRFYSRVLGTGPQPLWQENLLNNIGLPIIGVGERRSEFQHLPLQWMPHIQVADVAASVRRALELGGMELMHAKDNDGRSQWAVLQDPFGAAFGLIPVVAPEQLPPSERFPSDPRAVGRIAWLDLTVPEAPAARDFYREVVGWSVQDVAMQDDRGSYADYAMLGEKGTRVAGVCHARGVNADMPPVWMIYLPVGDLAESVRRAEEEGGRVLKVVGKDAGYRFAIVQDPVGAYFALWQA